MTQEIIAIIESIKEKITDSSNIVWSHDGSAKELLNELGTYILQLKQGDTTSLSKLYQHFLPTGTFQEYSILKGWTDEYIQLSSRFDKVYEAI